MTAQPGIENLFGLPAQTFASEHWTKKPLVHHGPPERLAGLIDAPQLRDVESIVNIPCHTLRADFRSLDGAPVQTMPKPQDAARLYQAGATLHLNLTDVPSFKPWIGALTRELAMPAPLGSVGIFASRRGEGVVPHFDRIENMVVQLRGRKRWRIAPNTTVRFPLENGIIDVAHASDKLSPNYPMAAASRARYAVGEWPKAMPADHQVFDLEPGSTLYVPRGWWHAVETLPPKDGEPEGSLHLTITFQAMTRVDLAKIILQRVLPVLLERDESWRETVTDYWSPQGMRPEVLRQLQQQLIEVVPELLKRDLTPELARAVLQMLQ